MNTTIEEGIFATVHANEININNQTDYSPYKITEITGEPYVRKQKDETKVDFILHLPERVRKYQRAINVKGNLRHTVQWQNIKPNRAK
jgi:hypothetical protein